MRSHSEIAFSCFALIFLLTLASKIVIPLIYSNDELIAVGDLWVAADCQSRPGEPGRELLYPVASAIVGGLISSTLLDVLLTPGVFLIFGLLSGFLKLSERVAEAELVKTVADGLDSALQIVDAKGGA